MSLFVDTNILLRIIQPSHPMHERAKHAMLAAISNHEKLVLTPQIMAEFWNAVTRPQANNGLGLSVQQASGELAALETFFSVLSESQPVYEEWKRLVSHYDVSGVKTHDTRIVAVMNVYHITRILTFNADDFSRYKEIRIITP